MNIRFKPWLAPNFMRADLPGQTSDVPFHLRDVPVEDIVAQCEAFRAEVFRKAGKRDPDKKEST